MFSAKYTCVQDPWLCNDKLFHYNGTSSATYLHSISVKIADEPVALLLPPFPPFAHPAMHRQTEPGMSDLSSLRSRVSS